jgi:hypothetical protein
MYSSKIDALRSAGAHGLAEYLRHTSQNHNGFSQQNHTPSRFGRPPLVDEFTDLPVSSQKKSRLRHLRDGLCVHCGGARPCSRHTKVARAQRREEKRLAAARLLSEVAELERSRKGGLFSWLFR